MVCSQAKEMPKLLMTSATIVHGEDCPDEVQPGFARKYPMRGLVRTSCGWLGSASSFLRRRLIRTLPTFGTKTKFEAAIFGVTP